MILAALQIGICLVFCATGAAICKNRRKGAIIGLALSVSAQLLTTLVLLIRGTNLALYSTQTPLIFYVKYLLAFTHVAIPLFIAGALLYGTIRLRPVKITLNWKSLLRFSIFLIFGFLSGGMLFASIWVTFAFGYITPDAMRFFLVGDTVGDLTPEMAHSVILYVLIPAIVFALVCALVALTPFEVTIRTDNLKKIFLAPDKHRRAKLTACLLMVIAIGYSCAIVPVVGTLATFVQTSSFIEEHYVEPTDKIMHFPEKPKNLVHIFLESIENSYYSKAEGGYLERSLMPDLAALTRENVSFSNTDKFGGPHQLNGATHSIAGMINMQSGLPLVPVALSTQWNVTYADFPNLGAILNKHGYNNSFMLGGDRSFHQLGDYFSKYAKFNIFDIHTAKERGLVPPNYHVWWGIEDDKLYEYAKMELNRLSAENKPFYFVLENADTHNNDGYLSPNIKEFPSDKQYGNVIHYSQRQVVNLVRWMQKQPWYKDTVIVLTGDHRSKDVTFFKGWDENYERTIVNIIINGVDPHPSPKVTHNRDFASFDMFPTIVHAMGIKIDGDQLGLGTNLYSGKPTLVERTSIQKVHQESAKRSPFYEKRLIRDLAQKEFKHTR